MPQNIPSAVEIAQEFARANIGDFHQKRIESLDSLKLKNILKRKNPYLFRAKNMLTAQELVNNFLDAHLSSQEETLFGDFLEKMIIHLNGAIYGGIKSSATGIDLEFDKDTIRYMVSIKSGPNWGNSSQIAKMKDNFRNAARILRTGDSNINFRAINGCCYGRDNKPDKGDYLKLCGQRFWEFATGDATIYKDVIEPLGHEARSHNEAFNSQRARISNQFTAGFIADFCHADGTINWPLLIEFNSAAHP